ncbi:MAG: hypothetical protein ACR2RE_12865 [Geminicoccaceae bacterium]
MAKPEQRELIWGAILTVALAAVSYFISQADKRVDDLATQFQERIRKQEERANDRFEKQESRLEALVDMAAKEIEATEEDIDDDIKLIIDRVGRIEGVLGIREDE